MKVIAFNGSPKKEGNTYTAIKLVASKLEEQGSDGEIVHVGNKVIRGCLACGHCAKSQDERCVTVNDEVNEWIQKMKEADGILLGSPTHYAAVAGTMKSFLDRAFYVAGANGGLYRNKVGAAVVAVRRSGGVLTFNQLNNFLNYSEMMMPTSNYWAVIHGTTPGDALKDAEGVQIMEILGKNMAVMLKQRDQTRDISDQNLKVKKIFTSFIR
ncbi:flavodoxin family protein [Oceanispirochaeta sp.]|jgi:multimeric flavodoxin WrbA|uniref:flavodoxin family protein n=1 Tax=Oceanispirochaeta sp. TaxID=2035350 RepID=UPI002629712F|nr:flavodoxin family protein [Oceanispirochaeta sp.]MDA3956333.1 flavodoxin family protein [Oceanispirochaeta sp.]